MAKIPFIYAQGSEAGTPQTLTVEPAPIGHRRIVQSILLSVNVDATALDPVILDIGGTNGGGVRINTPGAYQLLGGELELDGIELSITLPTTSEDYGYYVVVMGYTEPIEP